MLGTGKALMMISWLRTQNTDFSTISLLPDRLACTFLGPSRKRGPPKGYIDAIEARLHQTEALIGILLASKDSRAKTLLEDLSQVSCRRFLLSSAA